MTATELIRTLLSAMKSIDLRAADETELDNLERVCQGLAADIRKETRRRIGWTQRRWDAKGPGPRRMGNHDFLLPGGGIFDHAYRLVHREMNEPLYISEPYQLGEEELEELLQLKKDGWQVAIRAWSAVHFPGHTLAVVFRRADRNVPLPEP